MMVDRRSGKKSVWSVALILCFKRNCWEKQMTTWKHVENNIFFTLYGLATKKKFKLESLIFMTGFRNCSYVPLVHLNRRFRERFCIKKNDVFIKSSVGLCEWVCLPSQYFTFPCKREQKAKWKAEFDPYHVVRALLFLSIPTALLFLPPYWRSQQNYRKTLHPEVLTYMKNNYVKNVSFYWEYMLPVCAHLYRWFLWQKYHSWMNVTERNLECTFHCKSAPNVLTKFILILCVQRLWSPQDYTSATKASLC